MKSATPAKQESMTSLRNRDEVDRRLLGGLLRISKLLSTHEGQRLIRYLQNNKRLQSRQLLSKTEFAESTFDNIMSLLLNSGIVEKSFVNRAVYYSLTPTGRVIVNKIKELLVIANKPLPKKK